MENKCSVPWCDRKKYAKGFCHTHWMASRRYGTPYGRHNAEAERMLFIFQAAVKLAKAVVDIQGILGDECPFCSGHGKHAENCIYYQAAAVIKLA